MSKASFSFFRGELAASKKYEALKALAIAEDAHKGVIRKDGVTPYIEHPMKVASLLYDAGVDDDAILATAILHDVLEDCEVESIKSEVYQSFDSKIVEAVLLLTKPKNYDNEVYYGNIKKNPIATLVKLADRIHNLTTLFNFKEAKKAEYLKETVDFVYPLVNYAQHKYFQYTSALRLFDLWIESIVKNLEPYMEGKE